jgi:hypothetical protein
MTNGESPFWTDPAGSRRNLRLLRAFFWLATIVTGFLQAWSARFWLSPDGTNYLDIATAYLRGDWKNAVNAYWSPLFSWLLAFSLRVLHPTPYRESTLLHLLNFAALLVSLLSFEFFSGHSCTRESIGAGLAKKATRSRNWVGGPSVTRFLFRRHSSS